VSKRNAAAYSASRIADRVNALGREISRACAGRRLDVVITMDRAFIFGADLIRAINSPVVLHFVREAVQDVQQGGKARREVFFENRDAMAAARGKSEFKGRDVLLVDAVIDSGVTQDFLLRRLGEGRPRSIRLAVLLDKPAKRRAALEPDYFGFRTASNELWAGYGLSASNGTGRNAKNLVAGALGGSKRKAGRAKKKKG